MPPLEGTQRSCLAPWSSGMTLVLNSPHFKSEQFCQCFYSLVSFLGLPCWLPFSHRSHSKSLFPLPISFPFISKPISFMQCNSRICKRVIVGLLIPAQCQGTGHFHPPTMFCLLYAARTGHKIPLISAKTASQFFHYFIYLLKLK